MKHVAIIIKQIHNRSGGAERLYCDLANKLVEQGYKVSCLVFETQPPTPFYHLDPRVDLINLYIPASYRGAATKLGAMFAKIPLGTRFKEFGEFWADNLDFILQLKRFFKNQNVGASISFMPPANTVNGLATKGLKTVSIVTNHNVPEEDYENIERWSKNRVDIFLRKYVAIRADYIHVLFEEFGNWFPQKAQNKIRVIHNFVPKSFFESNNDYLSREKKIIAVGRLASVKNYSVLIKAWSLLKDEFRGWSVDIYGVGPQKKELQELMREVDVSEAVNLLGHTKDIASEFDKARIFCHPAIHEGFGLSVAEALAKKVPVIAFNDCAGVNQFVVNDLNGVMLDRGEDEAQSLAIGLRKLILSPSYQSELSANAQKSIAEFNEQKYIDNWVSLLREVAWERT